MSARIHISEYDTTESLWNALSHAFPVQENNGTTWVAFTSEGVDLTFFAPTAKAEADAEVTV